MKVIDDMEVLNRCWKSSDCVRISSIWTSHTHAFQTKLSVGMSVKGHKPCMSLYNCFPTGWHLLGTISVSVSLTWIFLAAYISPMKALNIWDWLSADGIHHPAVTVTVIGNP